MAENTKTFSIVINGIQESVKAVDALSDALSFLEQRMKAVQSSTVSVGGSSGSGGSTRTSALKQEDTLLKQIQKSEQDLINTQREEYQSLLANKDLIKQQKAEAESRAAAERLTANNYANTLESVKAKLADVKKVMQTTDMGSEKFRELATEANALNTKLKEAEESYGQFGRNVGNYASAAEGFTKVKVQVGDTVREFNNAREASRTLRQELNTMAINGEQGTEAFKDMQVAVAKLNSDMKDATVSSQAMDNLLDTLQSFAAIGQVTQGLSALLGFDDSEIEKSIQKLVALQNAMQGLEKIQQQMNSGEGIGGWISKGNKAIDKFVQGLFGAKEATNAVKVATEGATVAENANKVATEASTVAKEANTVAQTANNKVLTVGATSTKTLTTATVASTTATKAVTIATKAFGVALKGLGIGLVVAGIMAAVTALSKLIDRQKEAKKHAEDVKKAENDAVTAYRMARTEMDIYIERIKNFNGTKQQEKVLVEELNKKYGDTFGTFKTLSEWYKTLSKNSEEYCKQIKNEIKLQFAREKLEKAMRELREAETEEPTWYAEWTGTADEVKKVKTKVKQAAVDAAEENFKAVYNEIVAGQSKIDKKIKDNGNKTTKTVKEIEFEIAQNRINAMKDGLVKTLAQLNLERNRRIEEAKKSGKLIEEQIKTINAEYDNKVFKAKSEYYEKRINAEKQFWDSILQLQRAAREKSLELQKASNKIELDNALSELPDKNDIDALTTNLYDGFDKVISQYYKLGKHTEYAAKKVQELRAIVNEKGDDGITGKQLMNWEAELEASKDALDNLKKIYPSLTAIATKWSLDETNTLKNNIEERERAYRKYLDDRLKLRIEYINKNKELEKQKINNEFDKKTDEEKKRHSSVLPTGYTFDTSNATQESMDAFNEYLDTLKEQVDKGKITWEQYNEITSSTLVKSWTEVRDSLGENGNAMLKEWGEFLEKVKAENELFETNIGNITDEQGVKAKELEAKNLKERQQAYADYYSGLLKNVDTSMQAINKKVANATVTDKNWGIVNISATKKNLKEAEDAIKQEMDKIAQYRTYLTNAFNSGEISFDDFNNLVGILDTTASQLKEKGEEINESQGQVVSKFVQSCQKYIELAAQTFNQIMQAVWDAQDEEFDREQERIDEEWDKLNEQLEKKLDEQQDIIEQHKDNINSIEDELSSARGDRRARLIDMLSAEVAAQRAAQAQEVLLQKQKEAAEAEAQRKQDELDKKRRKAEYERNIIQAIVNGAMAVTFAAINKWPIPAIPMMALAGATTAAQLAIIMANKPYEKGGQLDGGVAQGKRHRDGGIPVLGGRASIEGGEFITNRRTTADNVDLLDYINSKHRKLTLDDFVNFYGDSKVRKAITSPTTKFADGGQVPTLNNVDVNDRLTAAFEEYANRPIYVAVTEIEKKQASLNRVRALAGLTAD